LAGEAHKTDFHLQNDRPDSLEPQRPEPGGVGIWGLLLHMVLMILLVPPTIIDALATVLVVVYIHRALRSSAHSIVVTTGAAPTSVLLLVAFLVVMVIGLGLLTWVLTLLARSVLDRRRWQRVLGGALAMLAVGVAVWAFTGAGLAATASVFGVFAYVVLVALGHVLWARRHALS
jgi:hypothetical protein